jgi:hypothetical protein
MVNSTDVTTLPLRLQQETQGGGAKGGTEMLPSFASSLGAVIDVAAAKGLGAKGNGEAVVPSQARTGAGGGQTDVPANGKGDAAAVKSLPEKDVLAGQSAAPSPAVPAPAVPVPAVADAETRDLSAVEGLKEPVRSDVVSAAVAGDGKGVAAKSSSIDAKTDTKTDTKTDAKTKAESAKTKTEKEQPSHKAESGLVTMGAAAVPQVGVHGTPQAAGATADVVPAGVVGAPVVQAAEHSVVAQQGQGADAAGTAARSGSAGGIGAAGGSSRPARPTQSAAAGHAETKRVAKETDDDNDAAVSAVAGQTPREGSGQGGEVKLQAHSSEASAVTMTAAVPAAAPVVHPGHGMIPVAAKEALAVPASRGEPAEANDGAVFEPRLGLHSAGGTIVATPSTLEVGVANGTQGWLKIRAELTDTGSVKAALSSTSAAGEQMLHRELPALSGFLDQERLSVSSLVVHHTAESSGLFAGSDNGGGARGQQPQGDAAHPGDQRRSASAANGEGGSPLEGLSEAQQQSEALVSAVRSSGGGWLSVRA